MRKKSLLAFLLWFFLLPALADSNTPITMVTAFYADLVKARHLPYVPTLKKYFSLSLYALLETDQKNRADSHGDLCGTLDFDPFFNTQDGTPRKIKSIQLTKPDMVQVIFNDDKDQPSLWVKVKKEQNEWKIDDIVYPHTIIKTNQSLVSILKKLQKETCN